MKRGAVTFTVLSLLAWIALSSAFSRPDKPMRFIVPQGWPKPHYDFKTNPLTMQGFKLGRELFYDPILSSDSSTSCASCHLSFTAFTHADHKLSHGIQGLVGTRNSSALINLAWSTSFMWDGGANNLEVQAINPLTNPVEMNSSLEKILVKLGRSNKYRKLFFRAFNDSIINTQRLLKAIAQFTGNLVSSNSKYDSVMRHEKNVHFTLQEQNGYALFRANCSTCHREPLFTNFAFENNGLTMDSTLKDTGRMKITNNPADSLRFKVPTLRNVEFSAPYFHDGRVNKLKDAVEHYISGITDSPTLARELKTRINMTSDQKKELVAFLKTLTDKGFLYNIQYRQTSTL
jgi:cytochrome c peroxidase